MNPLVATARFELQYLLRQPSFLLFALLSVGQGIWYAHQVSMLYAYTDPYLTSYLALASPGIALMIMAILMAGQSLTKDLDYRVATFFYSYPITSRHHFAGRFLGTYAATLLLALGYPLGILLYEWLAASVSSDLVVALVDGFVRLLAQNLLIGVSIAFSLSVFLRSLRGAYIALLLSVLYFLLTESSLNNVSDSDLWKLLDPFGVGMARESIEELPFSNDPGGLFTFSDLLLINRMLWMGLALGLVAYTEYRFTFGYFTAQPRQHRQSSTVAMVPLANTGALPTIQPQFSTWNAWKAIGLLTQRELKQFIRQPIFTVSLGLLLLLSGLLVTEFSQHTDFPDLPTTAHMTALRFSMGFFIGLFLLIMTVESLFFERSVGIDNIYHTLPQPTFVLLVPKLLALVACAGFLTLALALMGLGMQFYQGFSNIEWGLYATDLVQDGFLRYCQLIALGTLTAALTNNRILSHLINGGLFALLAVGYQWLGNERLFGFYSFLPGSTAYSDLIGYGPFASARGFVSLGWSALAGLFVVICLTIWQRGTNVPFAHRLTQWPARFQPVTASLVLALVGFAGLAYWQATTRLHPTTPTAIAYQTQHRVVSSAAGQPIAVTIRYHHPYQVRNMLRMVARAIRQGEQLFGSYPFANLSITETPMGSPSVQSDAGQICLAENQGWTADPEQPGQLDPIDYLISREVYKQWLVHKLKPTPQPGNGLITQSLAEYLALQDVNSTYGHERLHERLTQRTRQYVQYYQRSQTPETPLLQSTQTEAIARGRGALALTSLEQVWGARPLSFTIGQYYKTALAHPASATGTAFAQTVRQQLPDSLKYLTTYLSDTPWFEFKLGRVANLPNGITVEILTSKWRENTPGHRQPIPINDYVPLVVLDEHEQVLHRTLVHPNPDERFVALPVIPGARKVVIDPLGAWLEPNKYDNQKLL